MRRPHGREPGLTVAQTRIDGLLETISILEQVLEGTRESRRREERLRERLAEGRLREESKQYWSDRLEAIAALRAELADLQRTEQTVVPSLQESNDDAPARQHRPRSPKIVIAPARTLTDPERLAGLRATIAALRSTRVSDQGSAEPAPTPLAEVIQVPDEPLIFRSRSVPTVSVPEISPFRPLTEPARVDPLADMEDDWEVVTEGSTAEFAPRPPAQPDLPALSEHDRQLLREVLADVLFEDGFAELFPGPAQPPPEPKLIVPPNDGVAMREIKATPELAESVPEPVPLTEEPPSPQTAESIEVPVPEPEPEPVPPPAAELAGPADPPIEPVREEVPPGLELEAERIEPAPAAPQATERVTNEMPAESVPESAAIPVETALPAPAEQAPSANQILSEVERVFGIPPASFRRVSSQGATPSARQAASLSLARLAGYDADDIAETLGHHDRELAALDLARAEEKEETNAEFAAQLKQVRSGSAATPQVLVEAPHPATATRPLLPSPPRPPQATPSPTVTLVSPGPRPAQSASVKTAARPAVRSSSRPVAARPISRRVTRAAPVEPLTPEQEEVLRIWLGQASVAIDNRLRDEQKALEAIKAASNGRIGHPLLTASGTGFDRTGQQVGTVAYWVEALEHCGLQSGHFKVLAQARVLPGTGLKGGNLRIDTWSRPQVLRLMKSIWYHNQR